MVEIPENPRAVELRERRERRVDEIIKMVLGCLKEQSYAKFLVQKNYRDFDFEVQCYREAAEALNAKSYFTRVSTDYHGNMVFNCKY